MCRAFGMEKFEERKARFYKQNAPLEEIRQSGDREAAAEEGA